ncbi:MAG: hypothetical protein CVT68_08290 [Actinobacteria bacterium HGW-Actinobacteria-8]|nr:MAG: hypothetical protein CVT68_08290 [Actinobacteria bacterium HGW-Actinobacteria-8]
MIKSVARAAVLLTVAALLTGCVRFQSTNTFTADDTVTQDLIVALTSDAASQVGVDLTTLTAAALKGTDVVGLGVDPSKVTIEDYSEGDRKGVHIVAKDLTLDEFNTAAQAGVGEIAPGLGTPMTVERDGDTYVITIPADPNRDLSGVQGASAIGLISDSIDFAITFTFPGPVKSATAGQIDGKTVVLGLEDLLTPDEIVIRGQATAGIAWGPILKWGGLVAAAIVIVGGAALLIWQDKRRMTHNTLPPPVVTPDGGDGEDNVSDKDQQNRAP